MKKSLEKLIIIALIALMSTGISFSSGTQFAEANVLGTNPKIACVAVQNGVVVNSLNLGTSMYWFIIDLNSGSLLPIPQVGDKQSSIPNSNIAKAQPNTTDYSYYFSISDNIQGWHGTNTNGLYSTTYTTADYQKGSSVTFTAAYEKDYLTGTPGTDKLATASCTVKLNAPVYYIPGLQTILSAPTGLKATTDSSGKTNLTWNDYPNADHYNVKYSGVSGGPYTLLHTVNVAEDFDVGSSLFSGNYQFVVTAVVNNQESPPSNEVQVAGGGLVLTTPLNPNPIQTATLATPSGLQVTTTPNGSNYDVTLSWGAVSGADSYLVGSSTDPAALTTSNYIFPVLFPVVNSPTIFVPGVGAGTYYIGILAGANNGQSLSQVAKFTVSVPSTGGGQQTGTLSAPQNLVTTTTANGNNYDVTLSWDPVSGADSYFIGTYNNLTDTTPTFIFPKVTQPTITVPNVAAGTFYVGVMASSNGGTTFNPISKFTVKVPSTTSQQQGGTQQQGSQQGGNQQGGSQQQQQQGSQQGGNQQGGQQANLKSPIDIIKCSADKDKFYLDANGQTYDHIVLTCSLTSLGKVSFGIYKADFSPKNTDNSARLIKSLQTNKTTQPGLLKSIWDGYDSYDQIIPAGDYVFVAQAKPDDTYSPDISIQKFSVVAPAPAPEAPGTTTGSSAIGTTTSGNVTVTPAGGATVPGTGAQPTLHGAAPTSLSQNPQAGQASKCTGVNYPLDLPTGRFADVVIAAYDQCLVSGYMDGTFRAESPLSRAEAVKVLDLAVKIPPKDGCFTLDCGSPFKDLDSWQGKWVRAAWDQRVVSGTGPNTFEPNRFITRAETSALVVKMLSVVPQYNLAPHQGCYTANCGAGYPKNFFLDIIHGWEGPYIRALWDKGAALATGPNTFSPDRPITRGEFLEMLFAAMK